MNINHVDVDKRKISNKILEKRVLNTLVDAGMIKKLNRYVYYYQKRVDTQNNKIWNKVSNSIKKGFW